MTLALAQPDQCVLLVVDLQEKLLGAMKDKYQERTVENACRLITSASTLDIPIFYTEQYPKGLGTTNPKVLDALPETATYLEKTRFSVAELAEFQAFVADKPQVIICGVESHVCVLQTAVQLATHKTVFAVEDAICSRFSVNHINAINRMRQLGVQLTSSESVIFEWLGDAKSPSFKTLAQLLH